MFGMTVELGRKAPLRGVQLLEKRLTIYRWNVQSERRATNTGLARGEISSSNA